MNHRFPTQTAAFLPSDKLLHNPHKGFTTFQRFRGDKLNENWSVETGWKMEPPPKRSDVDGNIIGSGHPNSSVCYFRIPWNMVEPHEGEYDFSYVDFILSEAEKRKQTVMLRVYPNVNRPGPLELPEWFAKKVNFSAVREIGDKSTPNCPEYFKAFGKLIKKIGEHIDGNRRVSAVDMAMISAWGEGAQMDTVAEENWKMLVDTYLEGFKSTPLSGLIGHDESLLYANTRRPVGIRADCLGDMNYHMTQFYPRTFCRFNSLWEKAPVAFEVCWIVKHWLDMGWDIDYIIDQSLKWHISTFNEKSAVIPDCLSEKMDNWIKKMGYRFSLRIVDFPHKADSGDILHLSVFLENRGVAPIYHKYPLIVRLRHGDAVFDLTTNADITEWLPGGHLWEGEVFLPPNIPIGDYFLELGISDGNTKILFANEAECEDGFIRIGKITVN